MTDSGIVYTFGSNRKGVLGYKTNDSNIVTPTKVDKLLTKKIIKIDCGIDFNIALTEDG